MTLLLYGFSMIVRDGRLIRPSNIGQDRALQEPGVLGGIVGGRPTRLRLRLSPRGSKLVRHGSSQGLFQPMCENGSGLSFAAPQPQTALR